MHDSNYVLYSIKILLTTAFNEGLDMTFWPLTSRKVVMKKKRNTETNLDSILSDTFFSLTTHCLKDLEQKS